jgi:hypothetical protein
MFWILGFYYAINYIIFKYTLEISLASFELQDFFHVSYISILYLKHQFQRSSHVIFLQITVST